MNLFRYLCLKIYLLMLKSTNYLPAEWELQSGVQLTWPHEDTDWKPYLQEITSVFLEISRIILHQEKLLIVSPDIKATEALLKKNIDNSLLGNLRLLECDSNDTWARDHAFLTLSTGNAPLLLDFRFNAWGEKFAWEKDNAINRHLRDSDLLKGTYKDEMDFVLEGGSIESDGKGTIFTTSTCLLAPHRNQPLTKKDIEVQLKRRLHAQRIVWLNHGFLAGDDTDGHIDTLVRTAPNDTLLYVRCTEEDNPQYAELKALEQQLKNLKTMEGQSYRLLSLPMPDEITFGGEPLPATYANFLILNEAVIVPTYGQKDKDEEAMATIAKAFSGREITSIDARIIIRQHGSIHCLTMQYPENVII